MTSTDWIPSPTTDQVRAAEELKARYVGTVDRPPEALPPEVFRVPGRRAAQRRWPTYTYFPPPPVIDMRTWRFSTYGLVETPLNLPYAEFKKLPRAVSHEHHICVDNLAVPDHEFEGVAVSTIVDLVKPDADCRWLLFESDGGYSVSHPIERPLLLVYGRNGEPLDPSHGYPLRLWAPGEWGYKNPKWVRNVKFCEEREVDAALAWAAMTGGVEPDSFAGSETNVGSGVSSAELAAGNRQTYEVLARMRREWLHLRGARGWGQSEHRAPLIIGDEHWTPDNFEYGYGHKR